MEVTKIHLKTLLSRIREPEPFTFSRWGDGEWNALLGLRPTGTNCDGHRFFPAMDVELQQVLKDKPAYDLGMQRMALRNQGNKINAWLHENKLTDLIWYDADVFHYAAIHGHMDQLLQVVNENHVLMIGPDHLKRVKPQIKYFDFVDVPPKNCYLAKDRIIQDVLSKMESQKHKQILISVSASMPAEIIIHELYRVFGAKHKIIDFGSLWDPLVGVQSRSYMKVRKST